MMFYRARLLLTRFSLRPSFSSHDDFSRFSLVLLDRSRLGFSSMMIVQSSFFCCFSTFRRFISTVGESNGII